jgi:hypothetical protein
MERTPPRGAPNTAAATEEEAGPIAVSTRSSNAWLRFGGTADFARGIHSKIHIRTPGTREGATGANSQCRLPMPRLLDHLAARVDVVVHCNAANTSRPAPVTQSAWPAPRRNVGGSPHPEITPQKPHCLADDAVQIGPVSRPEFPANREINREFCGFWPSAAIFASDQVANSMLAAKFPTQQNREFFAGIGPNREFNRGVHCLSYFAPRRRRNERQKSSVMQLHGITLSFHC